MIDKFLVDLGLTEETVSAKELNGKFFAILRHSEKTGDPKIITVREETEIIDEEGKKTKLLPGDILAHQNPIFVQEIVEMLFPQYAGLNNKDGKHIQFCHIPKNLPYF